MYIHFHSTFLYLLNVRCMHALCSDASHIFPKQIIHFGVWTGASLYSYFSTYTIYIIPLYSPMFAVWLYVREDKQSQRFTSEREGAASRSTHIPLHCMCLWVDVRSKRSRVTDFSASHFVHELPQLSHASNFIVSFLAERKVEKAYFWCLCRDNIDVWLVVHPQSLQIQK